MATILPTLTAKHIFKPSINYGEHLISKLNFQLIWLYRYYLWFQNGGPSTTYIAITT